MSSSSEGVESWISSFCRLMGHEFFAEVSEDFIEDDFNLTGLSSQVPLYKEALEMILDVEPEDDEDDEEDDVDDDDDEDLELNDDKNGGASFRRESRRQARFNNDPSAVESSAELLYGLIHQRYITSRPGIGQMHEKYEAEHFGHCPRVLCNLARVLPVGCSDTPGTETVKLFCPSCLDVYTPPNSRFQAVDGAYFGTTFGCLFLMTFPELQINGQLSALSPSPGPTAPDDTTSPRSRTQHPLSTATPTSTRNIPPQPTEINGVSTANFAPGLGNGSFYEPKIYGFKISERAKSGPRMKWLRMKPDDIRELNEVRRFELLEAGMDHDGVELDEGDVEEEDDEDEIDDEPQDGLANGSMQAIEQGKALEDGGVAAQARKKAPIRRRQNKSQDSTQPQDTTMNENRP